MSDRCRHRVVSRHIYTTAVQALYEKRERKFQAVEMIYFAKWWDEAFRHPHPP